MSGMNMLVAMYHMSVFWDVTLLRLICETREQTPNSI